MRTYDLSPLFRSSVGFDRTSRLIDAALQLNHASQTYPPYDIVKSDEANYRITLAVAGFTQDELTVETEGGLLTVSGRHAEPEEEGVEYLHRGIAGRAFERRFQMTDHVHVVAARVEHGMLHIELQREIPEALKPRRIPIGHDDALIEAAAK